MKINYIVASIILSIIFSGCVHTSQVNKKRKSINESSCQIEDLNEYKSLEQQILNLGHKENFIPRINNISNKNPLIEEISLENIYNGNIEGYHVFIENLNSKDKFKQVYIQEVHNKQIINQIKKIKYKFKTNFIVAGELVRLFALNSINLQMDLSLQNKTIKINPGKYYSLLYLLNSFSEKLLKSNIVTSIDIVEEANIIRIHRSPFQTKYFKNEKEIIKFLKNNLIAFDFNDEGYIYIKDSFYKQLYSMHFIETREKYRNNRYSLCFNGQSKKVIDNIYTQFSDEISLLMRKIKQKNNSLNIYELEITDGKKIETIMIETNKKKYFVESSFGKIFMFLY